MTGTRPHCNNERIYGLGTEQELRHCSVVLHSQRQKMVVLCELHLLVVELTG
jgi:hypothetical protein